MSCVFVIAAKNTKNATPFNLYLHTKQEHLERLEDVEIEANENYFGGRRKGKRHLRKFNGFQAFIFSSFFKVE